MNGVPKAHHERLRQVVIEHSNADTWAKAKYEWFVQHEWEDEELDSCVCGKENIKYMFCIENYYNGNKLFPIGSSCINQFESRDMNEVVAKMLNDRKRIMKYKNHVFLHSKYANCTIAQIAEDESYMKFIIHERQPSRDKKKNKDYNRLIDYYNLKKQISYTI